MQKLAGTLIIFFLLCQFNCGIGAATTGKQKCRSKKVGVWYAGDVGSAIENIKSADDCQNLCESDTICYGWQYQGSTQNCWLQTSIGTEYTDKSYTAGSCLGPAAKQATCTELLSNTYYSGESSSPITNVASAQACMKKCDADATCLGWSYASGKSTCWTQTSVSGKVTSSKYVGGSCIKPQAPYPPISLDAYRQQVLDAHNMYRSKHGAPPLTWNPQLNDIAQNYAESMAATKNFAHSTNTLNGDYIGENLYASSGSGLLYKKGSEASASWYNEIADYDWSKPGFDMDTGHFTQLVWKETKSLGVGRAISQDNRTLYIVANYYPAGNMGGGYETNVLESS